MEGAQKTPRNFQPITGSLLKRQYIVMLTSQSMQSKETENRDTPWNKG